MLKRRRKNREEMKEKKKTWPHKKRRINF